MEYYKVGIYSNKGNVLKQACISTMAPSNWTTNVLNANGGRLSFIKDGFTFEDAEYDIEAEAELITLNPGTYYLDYKTTNSKIKAYIFPASPQQKDKKRTTEEILDTKDDEKKNILKRGNKFTITKKGTYNLRFKGKSGTVSNICIKDDKNSDFVETDYKTTEKQGSQVVIDLTKIKYIEMEGQIFNVPEYEVTKERPYSIFKTDRWSTGLTNILSVDTKLSMIYDGNTLKCNSQKIIDIDANIDKYLDIFDNVNAVITKLIITDSKGQRIDIILQKTNKITISKNNNSPIIVTDSDNLPYDLSASFREIANDEVQVEIFNAKNPIKLSRDLDITNTSIKIFGADNLNAYCQDHTQITSYDPITPNVYNVNVITGEIKFNKDIKEKYKYFLIQYNAYDDFTYIYTNWEREIFYTESAQSLYLEKTIRNNDGNLIVYGIPYDSNFNLKMLYRISDPNMINSIDMFSQIYNILDEDKYTLNTVGKLTIDSELRKKYKMLIIDYLKDKSYCINEKEDYYEIDISSEEEQFKIMYDSKDGNTTETYKALNFATPEKGDFIVLEKA